MTRDYSAAVAAAGQLHPEEWFADRTRAAVAALGPDLEQDLGADETVSLAAAVMVATTAAAQPGLLAVVPGSRFLLCWRDGAQTFRESYQLGSVPVEVTTGTVAGIDAPVSQFVLTDRRLVVPSVAVAEQLRVQFTGPPVAVDAEDPTQLIPAQTPDPTSASSESGPETAILPPIESTKPTAPPTPIGPGSGPALSGSQPGRSGSGRKIALIVVAAVVALLLLGGAAYGIYRVSQVAGSGPGPVTSPAPSSAPATEPEPSPDPTDEPTPDSPLPQSAEPLADDTMLIRRNDGSEWRIETISTDGATVTVLADGQANRGIVLTPDRRTVLFLRVAGDTSTLRAVAADGADGRGLFSDGTSECPKLAQPAVSVDNVLAVACSGSLNLMGLDGRLIRVLDRGRVGDPTFTPDGSQIIYWKATGSGDGGALYRIPVDGSAEPTLLAADDDGPFDDPVCSPDGSLIAASQTRDGVPRIVTLSATGDTSAVTVLSAEGTAATGPSWSPDASRIAYRIGPGDDSGLAVMNADGSDATDTLPNQTFLANPVWTAH